MQQKTVAITDDVPQIIEEIDEIVRLIPQERIQQRTSRRPRISRRDRDGENGPDYSPERVID